MHSRPWITAVLDYFFPLASTPISNYLIASNHDINVVEIISISKDKFPEGQSRNAAFGFPCRVLRVSSSKESIYTVLGSSNFQKSNGQNERISSVRIALVSQTINVLMGGKAQKKRQQIIRVWIIVECYPWKTKIIYEKYHWDNHFSDRERIIISRRLG